MLMTKFKNLIDREMIQKFKEDEILFQDEFNFP